MKASRWSTGLDKVQVAAVPRALLSRRARRRSTTPLHTPRNVTGPISKAPDNILTLPPTPSRCHFRGLYAKIPCQNSRHCEVILEILPQTRRHCSLWCLVSAQSPHGSKGMQGRNYREGPHACPVPGCLESAAPVQRRCMQTDNMSRTILHNHTATCRASQHCAKCAEKPVRTLSRDDLRCFPVCERQTATCGVGSVAVSMVGGLCRSCCHLRD